MIVIVAKNNGWLFNDPFSNFKIRSKRVDRGYLTDQEIQTIMEKSLVLSVWNRFVMSLFFHASLDFPISM